MPLELSTLTVPNALLWRQWLLSHHATSPGVWLTLAKKTTGTNTSPPTTLTYQQALEEALCFGFIDGQARKTDAQTYAQRFTPRTPKSAWSKRNVGIIARLEQDSRMHASGKAAVDAAKADGRWDAAYAGSKDAILPQDFLDAVAKSPGAERMWEELDRQNRYVVYMRLAGLKTVKGRERRIEAFVRMLERGEMPLGQKEKGFDGGKKRRGDEVEVEVVDESQPEPDVAAEELTTRSGRKVRARYK